MNEGLITKEEIENRQRPKKNTPYPFMITVISMVDFFVIGTFFMLFICRIMTARILIWTIVYLVLYNLFFAFIIHLFKRGDNKLIKEIRDNKIVINIGVVKSMRISNRSSNGVRPYIEGDQSYFATIEENDEEIRITKDDYHVLKKGDYIYIVRTSNGNLGGWACRAHDLAPELERLLVVPANLKKD